MNSYLKKTYLQIFDPKQYRVSGLILLLFVQKDELEKGEFYYLGKVIPIKDSEKQIEMSRKEETVPVVTINFELEYPVPFELYQYLVNR